MLFECHGKALLNVGMPAEANKRKVQIQFQAVAPAQGNVSMIVEPADAANFEMGDVYELVKKQ